VTNAEALYQKSTIVRCRRRVDSQSHQVGHAVSHYCRHLEPAVGAEIETNNSQAWSWRRSLARVSGRLARGSRIGFVADNETPKKALRPRAAVSVDTRRGNDDLYSHPFCANCLAVDGSPPRCPQKTGDLSPLSSRGAREFARTLAAMRAWHPPTRGGIIMKSAKNERLLRCKCRRRLISKLWQRNHPLVFANRWSKNGTSGFDSQTLDHAGYRLGAITARDLSTTPGCITLIPNKICNSTSKLVDVIPDCKNFESSLNVGASFIATKDGPERYARILKNHYDLGNATGSIAGRTAGCSVT